MKKTFLLAIAAMMTLGVFADDQKKEKDPNEPVFTTIVANPITSIKNQARSGTCWAYSTLAFFESEILKKTKKNIDLCEMFVANKDYMDRAILKVRMHGDAQFSQGGSAYDVFYVLKNYGICPEDAMPLPGTMYGDTLNNFNQFFKVMEPYVDAIAKSESKKLNQTWKVGFQGILDAYPVSYTHLTLPTICSV